MRRRQILAAGLALPLPAACAGALPPEADGGLAGRPDPSPAPPPRTGEAALVTRDWHSDLGLAVAALEGRLARMAAETWPGAQHLVIGFGDAAWLLHRGPRGLGDMVAALLPGPGAMLVTALSVPPAEAFGTAAVIALPLTPAGLRGLHRFVEASFAWEEDGRPRRLAEGPYAGARFFASRRTYSALYTCNTWSAEGLMRAGLPASPFGVAFAGQVEALGRAVAAP